MASRKPAGGRKVEEVDPNEGVPIILVPTPAQLAAGQRVIDADPAVWPQGVKSLVRKAKECGWETRVSYSSYLDKPHAGQRKHRHKLCVRLSKGWTQAYGCWVAEEGGGGWSAETDGAQACNVIYGRTGSFGVTDLGRLVDGTMMIVRGAGGCARLVPAEGTAR